MLNQTKFHKEERTFEVIVGQTTQYSPSLGLNFPNKGVIPLPATKTGTISTDNTDSTGGVIVRGVNTLFCSELNVGDFIFNGVSVRKVKYIISDTMLQLEVRFPSSLSGQALQVPPQNEYRMIIASSIDVSAAGNPQLQEVDFPAKTRIVNGSSPLTYDCSVYGKIHFSLSQ